MSERNRFFTLILILIVICLSVTGISMAILYKTALEEERERLTETAKSQARLIEAISRFDTIYSKAYPEGPLEATLSQIRDAHHNYRGFGETGEFTLAQRKGNEIVFLLSHRHYDLDNPRPVRLDSNIAEPMRRALSGQSGTLIGLDYRGEEVLAAYEPLEALGLGIVAKIDLAEVRAPFFRAAIVVIGVMLLFVALGTALFLKISNPIIRRLEAQNKRLYQANQELAEKIKEQEKTAQSLQETEKRLVRAQLIARMGDFTWDSGTGKITWSEALYHLLGYDPNEPMDYAKVNTEIHHPEDLKRITRWLMDSIAAGKETLAPNEYRLIRKGGTVLHVRCQGVIQYEEGKSPTVFGTVQDVTERKEMEQGLKKSKALLDATGRMARVGGWELDSKTLEVIWTKETYRIHEVSLDYKPPLKEAIHFFHPEDRERLSQAIQQAMGEGVPYDLELRFITAKGNQLWTRTKCKPEFQNGEVVRLMGTFQDITELHLAQEEAKRVNRELETRVKERTRQLEMANKELESFAYSVSHDLRAPLRAISGFAEIIAERHRAELSKQGLHYFDNIVEASEQMGRLIEDLLSYSRLGRRAVRRETVALNDLFSKILQNYQEKINQTRANVHVPESFPVVQGDPTMLHIILSNIIDNALTYHNPGDPPEIRMFCKPCETGIQIGIQDAGIGIDPKYHDKIFDLFQRLQPQSKYPGTGIGLGLVKKAVDHLEGRVYVESGIGEGSTFYIELPVG